MKDDSDPLQSWCIHDILQHAPSAKKDMYGSLFFYLRKLLLQFCRRIRSSDVDLQIFHVNALELPNLLKGRGQASCSFDRIEVCFTFYTFGFRNPNAWQVSNITDRGYVGPGATLSTFGPLLKPASENPKATLLALFLNAVHENESYTDSIITSLKSDRDRISRYLKVTRDMSKGGSSNADLMRLIGASSMFRDFDKPFRQFMEQCRFGEISTSNGLRVKGKHSIVESWPLRLKHDTTKEEFDVLHASGHIGSERYVEWERVI